MAVWFQICIGFAIGYLAATSSESYFHRTIGHATPRLRRVWARHPRLFGFLVRAHYRHAVVHHGLTFARDHVTQFATPADQARVDTIISNRRDRLIKKECYGLTIGSRSLLTYNITTAPVLLGLFWLCGPVSCLGALPVAFLAPLLSMFVHPYLHLRRGEVQRRSPRLVAFLLRTRYFRAVARHHYLHHKYQRFNFNLLLGGDWLFGTHRRPNRTDLLAMSEVDIPID